MGIVEGVERGDLSRSRPVDSVAAGEFGSEWGERDRLALGGSERGGLYRRKIRGSRLVEEVCEPWLDGGHRGTIVAEGRALETVRALPGEGGGQDGCEWAGKMRNNRERGGRIRPGTLGRRDSKHWFWTEVGKKHKIEAADNQGGARPRVRLLLG